MTVDNARRQVEPDMDPADWVEQPDRRLDFLDGSGDIVVSFTEYRLLDEKEGEMVPANPPSQPGAVRIQIGRVADPSDMSGPPEEVLEETPIPADTQR